ncbi:MOXD1 homolog 2 isoform X2 [Folsomia candida]|uniref:MOXD1 homolog 2 isoform X2 n=1 Tax=Folsomia candida TaxID=158441 RepID=UPI000B8F927A|nr:MOXD1 homolog 2 isoform X2 [Folsomia candida]
MLGKKSQTILVAILSILFCLSSVSNGVFIDIQDGLFVVNATMENDTLHVSIVAETIGYVAFGPSPEGMMTGSDVIIAGYDPITQTSYIGDHFFNFRPPPIVDTIQNVRLLWASENGTHTSVSFTRPLDTGDTLQDLPIQVESNTILYMGYGVRRCTWISQQ